MRLLLAVLLTWACCFMNACASGAPDRQRSMYSMQSGLGSSVVSESILDTTNRYLSVVKLSTSFAGKGGVIFSTCSGVLLHPRLVLTAGHCVCFRHKASDSQGNGRFLVDATQCAKTANVTAVLYEPLPDTQRQSIESELAWPVQLDKHRGVVHPHPELKIQYSDETSNQELSSNADLATVVLDEAVDSRFQPIGLARKKVQVAETITLVGYGVTNSRTEDGGVRRIGTNEIASLEETHGKTFRVAKPLLIPPTFSEGESLLMREHASYVLRGDSGGPCFRETGVSFELIGIAKTSFTVPVEFSEYTSTLFYQDWIRQEIGRAQRAGASTPTD